MMTDELARLEAELQELEAKVGVRSVQTTSSHAASGTCSSPSYVGMSRPRVVDASVLNDGEPIEQSDEVHSAEGIIDQTNDQPCSDAAQEALQVLQALQANFGGAQIRKPSTSAVLLPLDCKTNSDQDAAGGATSQFHGAREAESLLEALRNCSFTVARSSENAEAKRCGTQGLSLPSSNCGDVSAEVPEAVISTHGEYSKEPETMVDATSAPLQHPENCTCLPLLDHAFGSEQTVLSASRQDHVATIQLLDAAQPSVPTAVTHENPCVERSKLELSDRLLGDDTDLQRLPEEEAVPTKLSFQDLTENNGMTGGTSCKMLPYSPCLKETETHIEDAPLPESMDINSDDESLDHEERGRNVGIAIIDAFRLEPLSSSQLRPELPEISPAIELATDQASNEQQASVRLTVQGCSVKDNLVDVPSSLSTTGRHTCFATEALQSPDDADVFADVSLAGPDATSTPRTTSGFCQVGVEQDALPSRAAASASAPDGIDHMDTLPLTSAPSFEYDAIDSFVFGVIEHVASLSIDDVVGDELSASMQLGDGHRYDETPLKHSGCSLDIQNLPARSLVIGTDSAPQRCEPCEQATSSSREQAQSIDPKDQSTCSYIHDSTICENSDSPTSIGANVSTHQNPQQRGDHALDMQIQPMNIDVDSHDDALKSFDICQQATLSLREHTYRKNVLGENSCSAEESQIATRCPGDGGPEAQTVKNTATTTCHNDERAVDLLQGLESQIGADPLAGRGLYSGRSQRQAELLRLEKIKQQEKREKQEACKREALRKKREEKRQRLDRLGLGNNASLRSHSEESLTTGNGRAKVGLRGPPTRHAPPRRPGLTGGGLHTNIRLPPIPDSKAEESRDGDSKAFHDTDDANSNLIRNDSTPEENLFQGVRLPALSDVKIYGQMSGSSSAPVLPSAQLAASCDQVSADDQKIRLANKMEMLRALNDQYLKCINSMAAKPAKRRHPTLPIK